MLSSGNGLVMIIKYLIEGFPKRQDVFVSETLKPP